jgi:hypothetical protein
MHFRFRFTNLKQTGMSAINRTFCIFLIFLINTGLSGQETFKGIMEDKVEEIIEEEYQERINISAGIGIPELLNLGFRYQLFQRQLAIQAGFMPVNDEQVFSIGGHYTQHFAGFTELSERYPWFLRGGINYSRSETPSLIDRYVFANLRVGRDFNFTRNLGFELDGGVTFQLYHDETVKIQNGGGFRLGIYLPVYPSFSFSLFYRIRRLD